MKLKRTYISCDGKEFDERRNCIDYQKTLFQNHNIYRLADGEIVVGIENICNLYNSKIMYIEVNDTQELEIVSDCVDGTSIPRTKGIFYWNKGWIELNSISEHRLKKSKETKCRLQYIEEQMRILDNQIKEYRQEKVKLCRALEDIKYIDKRG